MKSKGGFLYFLRNFNRKHRLSVRDEIDDSEVWYMYITPLRICTAVFGLVILIFGAVLLIVSYTPILDLAPGYPGSRSREELIAGILRLDSLENELKDMQVYSENVTLIMEGKTPVIRTMKRQDDTVRTDKRLVSPSREDSLLRVEMEGSGRYGLVKGPSVREPAAVMEFVAPVRGNVSVPFDPKVGIYGVGITPESTPGVSQQVVAVRDGTVILALWTPEEGYVAQVQHPGNMVSVYKRNTQLLKSVGDRVKAGEVIGYIDSDNVSETGREGFVFELWYDGLPVDPQKYIGFGK